MSRFTIIAALLHILALTARAEVRYSVTELPTFGGTAGEAFGLNDRGYIVGQSPIPAGVSHAFLYDGSSLIDLTTAAGNSGTFGTYSGIAKGVNELGQVVGFATSGAILSPMHAFLYDSGVTTDLGTLGGPASRAAAINNSGRVVGEADTGTIQNPGPIHAFLWSALTGTQDLGALAGQSHGYAINDVGEVVGSTGTSSGVARAFVWTPSTGMVALGTLGGRNSAAYGINNLGQVIGLAYTSYADGNSQEHAFLYDPQGGMRDLGALGGSDSEAFGINDKGWVVGWSLISNNPDDIPHAFLYDGTSMSDLNDLIDPSLGWTMFYAYDINNAGQIVVDAVDTNHRFRALLLTPIPEPASLGLLVAGGAGLAVRRSTRRHVSK